MRVATITDVTDGSGAVTAAYLVPEEWEIPDTWHGVEGISAFTPDAILSAEQAQGMVDSLEKAGYAVELPPGLLQ